MEIIDRAQDAATDALEALKRAVTPSGANLHWYAVFALGITGFPLILFGGGLNSPMTIAGISLLATASLIQVTHLTLTICRMSGDGFMGILRRRRGN